jgi:ferredoxin-type protein NapH
VRQLRETVATMVKKSKFNEFISRIVPRRVWVQSAFLLVWLDPAGLRLHNICGPVFHCYACPLATFACPIGVIAQFGAVQLFPFIAVGLLLTLGALFGSVICGWVCPFGLLQDLAAKVPVKKFKLPAWSGYFRYVVLVVAVLAVPYFFGEGHWLFICRVCPAGALEKAVPDMVSQAATGQSVVFPSGVKLSILAVFLVAIFISIRPWCRVLCPLGAIFAFFNRFSVFSMKLDEYKCTKCNRCRTLCSYGIEPDITPNSDRCIRCLECTKCGPAALAVGTVFDAAEEQAVQTSEEDSSSAEV